MTNSLRLSVTTALLALSVSVNGATMGAFNEDFSAGNNPQSVTNFYYGSGGNMADFTWLSGQKSTVEPSSEILRLTMDPAEKPGAWQGPNMISNDRCHFGTFAARLKIPSVTSQPNIGGVVGFYSYYNDQWDTELPADINKNGLYDNSEIDFEWLIADPTIIYLTAWTDHQELPNSNACRKVSRIINLAKGIIYNTEYSEDVGGVGTKLSGVENVPSAITPIPGFNASKQFYTYGFDWKSDQIRWWILHPETNDTIVLWDYRGSVERITQKEASLMMNIWHTNDWSVVTNAKATEAPRDTFSVEFDWVSYTPAGQVSLVSPEIRSTAQVINVSRDHGETRISLAQSGSYTVDLFSIRGEKLGTANFVGTSFSLPEQSTSIIVRISESGKVVATNLVPKF